MKYFIIGLVIGVLSQIHRLSTKFQYWYDWKELSDLDVPDDGEHEDWF